MIMYHSVLSHCSSLPASHMGERLISGDRLDISNCTKWNIVFLFPTPLFESGTLFWGGGGGGSILFLLHLIACCTYIGWVSLGKFTTWLNVISFQAHAKMSDLSR
uniref:Uncharacterized protein n=1 Tax=Opuntia streptacantha TaxID=393608 RepID=A0A7C9EHY9_OPUST